MAHQQVYCPGWTGIRASKHRHRMQRCKSLRHSSVRNRRSLTGWKIPHVFTWKKCIFVHHSWWIFLAPVMLVLWGGQMWGKASLRGVFFRLDVELSLLTDLTQRIFGRTKPSQPPYRYAIIADVYNYAYCMRENMGIDINILDVVGMWGPLARRNATLIKFV